MNAEQLTLLLEVAYGAASISALFVLVCIGYAGDILQLIPWAVWCRLTRR